MKRYVLFCLASLGATLTLARGDGDLSAERLDMLDAAGYFTPGFKSAVHELVDNKHALKDANAEQAKLKQTLPGLQQQVTEAQAKTIGLRQELAKYDHPEENDYVTLQNRMRDPGVKAEEKIELAQAYVWTYPASSHQGEAQQYLSELEKTQIDQQQAEKEAEAARAAAHEKLVLRAQAHDLNLGEWREFLRDMSQDDLVKLMGRPTSTMTGDYWIYAGNWIYDSTTKQKVGLEITFNAGRVINVDEKPSPP
jgi:hypothetical protein